MRSHIFVDKTQRDKGVIHTGVIHTCLYVSNKSKCFLTQKKKYMNTLICGHWAFNIFQYFHTYSL